MTRRGATSTVHSGPTVMPAAWASDTAKVDSKLVLPSIGEMAGASSRTTWVAVAPAGVPATSQVSWAPLVSTTPPSGSVTVQPPGIARMSSPVVSSVGVVMATVAVIAEEGSMRCRPSAGASVVSVSWTSTRAGSGVGVGSGVGLGEGEAPGSTVSAAAALSDGPDSFA